MEIGWAELGALFGRRVRPVPGARGHIAVPQSRPPRKRLMAKLAQTEPKQLRWGGLISMVVGLALLWMVRNG